MKLPITFDEDIGIIFDADDIRICHVLYSHRKIDQQKQDMRDIVEAVNRTAEDGQGRDASPVDKEKP